MKQKRGKKKGENDQSHVRKMTWVEVQTSQLNKLSTFLFLYVFLFFIFVIVFLVDILMNIGHDDGPELLEEETLDKHN